MLWGDVSSWMDLNFDRIVSEIECEGNANKVFRENANGLPFSVSAIKQTFYRRRAKMMAKEDPDYREHGNQRMSQQEEAMLTGYLLMRSEIAQAEKAEGIVHFTKAMLGQPISLASAYRFIHRKEYVIRSTTQKVMTSRRCDAITIDHTAAFVRNMEILHAEYAVNFDHFVNADETILRGGKDGCSVKKLEARHKSGGSDGITSKISFGSMTPFVSASGIVWLLSFCLKLPASRNESHGRINIYVPAEKRESRAENSPYNVLILGSSSGLLDSQLWDVALKRFIKTVRERSITPSKEIFLLTDNLATHRQLPSIQSALQQECYQLFFPPNCSQFIQPLDDILFAGLKRKIYKFTAETFCDDKMWNHRQSDLQKIVMDAVVDSFPSIFSVRNIKKAWKRVGVHPFDPEMIMKRAHDNVGDVSNPDTEDKRNTAGAAMETTAKRIFMDLYETHVESEELKKGKTKRVSISTDWAESGMSGVHLVDAAAKQAALQKEKEDKRAEDEKHRREEREKKEDEKRARKEERERKKNQKDFETAERLKKIVQERKEREEKKEEEQREKEKSKAEREEMKREKNKHTCKAKGCRRRWTDKVHLAQKWEWCGTCDYFGFCDIHVQCDEHQQAMKNHEEACSK